MSLKIEKIPFGNMPDGRTVYKFRMTNESGAVAEVCNYGATLVNIEVPDKSDKLVSVVKAFPSLEGYLADRGIGTYLGATCGRYANRIAKARFVLEGLEYSLAANNGDNSLHGGIEGFHTKYWDFETDEEYVHF
ncbi:MAG: galactose-1-epimerase, partial [Bacteroidales bacterium]|nr:galactose-1-epimerase [Bacteroidales bacterium]